MWYPWGTPARTHPVGLCSLTLSLMGLTAQALCLCPYTQQGEGTFRGVGLVPSGKDPGLESMAVQAGVSTSQQKVGQRLLGTVCPGWGKGVSCSRTKGRGSQMGHTQAASRSSVSDNPGGGAQGHRQTLFALNAPVHAKGSRRSASKHQGTETRPRPGCGSTDRGAVVCSRGGALCSLCHWKGHNHVTDSSVDALDLTEAGESLRGGT